MSRPVRRQRVSSEDTPVRAALKAGSTLLANVRDGLKAIDPGHHKYFDNSVRPTFGDSLDIDEAFREGREQEHRWDYILGHSPSSKLIGVEPHSARTDQITTVKRKREAALLQLREHLHNGVSVYKWLWVASGDVGFLALEKARFDLLQSGIDFVGRKVEEKHLAGIPERKARRAVKK